MSDAFSIGDLSRATGVKATTIRFYETEGLLPPPGRTEGGHRVYARAHLDRLGFIRHARELGFAMEDIRELLRRYLERADYAVLTSATGAEAIGYLEGGSVDLVLLAVAWLCSSTCWHLGS